MFLYKKDQNLQSHSKLSKLNTSSRDPAKQGWKLRYSRVRDTQDQFKPHCDLLGRLQSHSRVLGPQALHKSIVYFIAASCHLFFDCLPQKFTEVLWTCQVSYARQMQIILPPLEKDNRGQKGYLGAGTSGCPQIGSSRVVKMSDTMQM